MGRRSIVAVLAGIAAAVGAVRAGDDAPGDRGLALSASLDAAVVIDSAPPSMVASVPVSLDFFAGDCVISRGGELGYVAGSTQDVWVIDMTATPPSPASGVNPIHLTPEASDLALSPDGRYLLSCAIFNGGAISVIDLGERLERSVYTLGDGDCSSIDVCGDGSVLVTSLFSGRVRRLVLDANGLLTDSGNAASVVEPVNVTCAPDSRSAVVVSQGASILSSFLLPELDPVSERVLTGGVGISGTFSTDGRTFYARDLVPGVEAYGYDPASGAIATRPHLSLTVEPSGVLVEGAEAVALDPTGTKLLVLEPSVLRAYDARVGRPLGSAEIPSLIFPTGICFRSVPDGDADGLTDELEASRGTNPADPDTDDDGLLDGLEANYGLDPLTPGDADRDPDQDGLSSLGEQSIGTDPSDADSDDDGLNDGAEIGAGTLVLDADTDDDEVPDGPDNCRLLYNPGQSDMVHPDGVGDECQDPDGDEILDIADNCPDVGNPTQQDEDTDSVGDACDPCLGDRYNDPDEDGTCAASDNCPDAANPGQEDGDADGFGDPCDTCPGIANPGQDERAACIEVLSGNAACLEARVDVIGEIDGAISIHRAYHEPPEQLRFEALGFSCTMSGVLQLALNGVAIGTLTIDPAVTCSCASRPQTLVIDDQELLADLWDIGGTNTFGVRLTGGTVAFSWVRVTAMKAHTQQATCLREVQGGNCTDPNPCSARTSFESFDAAYPVRDRVAEDSSVLDVPIVDSGLPERIDLGSLEDHLYDLCVVAPAGTDCRLFTKQGESSLAINGARCAPPSAPTAAIAGGGEGECTSGAGRSVTLSGTASSDPDSSPGTNDDIVLYEWLEDFGSPEQEALGTGSQLTSTFALGSHVVTLRVTDRDGMSGVATTSFSVVDTTPPTISVTLTPSVLAPANRRLVDVTAHVHAADACGGPTVTLLSVTSSEPDGTGLPGDIQGAAIGTADFSFKLRAERTGRGSGQRVYTATYRVDDGHGNVAEASATATVSRGAAGR